MKIIIVDDNRTFRQGLKYFLEKRKKFKVINEASDGAEFLSLSNINEADLILMDINMPESNGIETAKKILWRNPNHKILAITMFKERAYLLELIGAGIKGCVFKNEIHEKLENAIKAMVNDEYFFPEDIQIHGNKKINSFND